MRNWLTIRYIGHKKIIVTST